MLFLQLLIKRLMNMTRMFKILSISLLLFPATTQAQLRKIPASVTKSFKEKYPQAENVEWKDKLTQFAALFESNDVKYDARFDSKGHWIQTEFTIGENELPPSVKDGMEKSKYADWKWEELYKVELPEDSVQYRILAGKSDLQKRNLLFNSAGRLLKDKITL